MAGIGSAIQGVETDDEAQYILTRFNKLLLEQRLFGILWQEIADYVMPRKNSIVLQRIPGDKRTQLETHVEGCVGLGPPQSSHCPVRSELGRILGLVSDLGTLA